MTKRITTILLLLSMLVSAAACGGGETTDPTTTPAGGDTSAEVTDPLAGLDFGGEKIHVLVSANDYDSQGSSCVYIISEEEETGDVVQDAVFQRNMAVEELLNVTFEFTENKDNYAAIPTTISTLVLAGDDTYDYIIHDLFPLATLSVQGNFLNVYDSEYMDFSKPYWYTDFMKGTSFDSDEKCYLLAGDYFLDILRTSHVMYVNKEMYEQHNGSVDDLYKIVFDGGWTQDKFLESIKNAYRDENGNTTADDGDVFGYVTSGYWGPMIPWAVASDLEYLSYDSDGTPSFALNNERSVKLLENLNKIFHHEATNNVLAYDTKTPTERMNNYFSNGLSMFSGYQFVRSLETFRDIEFGIGLLPYPKMDEAQEDYVTSVHDTTNVGVIPVTCKKFDMVGAVLEACGRFSQEKVIPAYYDIALKEKYVRDETSAKMLDMIRTNVGDVFPLAFGDYCNKLPINKAFRIPLEKNSNDFASNYAENEPLATEKLAELWDAFKSAE